ncbi:L polymerase RdRp [Lasius neglectus virus 2]|uniref:Replicase n=1 Tax=Lasius neglectus virus 2 TaxID=2170211 RepID=A0A3G5FMH6_9VIRU|nr:L polymerase RdRp [Lasius neglectus virus 2]AYW51543.1 L polymerase RdRp [Lasius neglectus virus 2]UXD80031.1 L polymerase RNA-dependent RNA polymerase [Lasius neglectus virus 2]
MWEFNEFDLRQAFGDEESFSPLAPAPPLSTHCNVPLKYNKQRAAISKPSFGQYSTSKNQYMREFEIIKTISGPTNVQYFDLCHVQFHLLNSYTPTSNTLTTAEWEQQTRVSQSLWRDQSLALTSICSESFFLPDYQLSEDQSILLKPYYMRKAFFEEGVLSSGSDSFRPTLWWRKEKGVSYYRDYNLLIVASKNLTLIVTNNVNVLVSRDHLLILSDLAAQRYILLKYSLLSMMHPKPPFISPGMLIEYLELGDTILHKGGNDAYKIVSNFEPLCLSYLVGDLPVGTRSGKTFKTLIINELHHSSNLLNVTPEVDAIISLLTIAETNSPSYLTELYGLYRIWGHPTIEPLEGATALKKIATRVRVTNQDLVDKITNKFKEEFICRYIAKEHVWPDLNLKMLPSGNIIVQAHDRKSGFPNKHKDYRREDLKMVHFNTLFPIDPKFDLIELIADKALSLLTPELVSQIIKHNNCGLATDRSVLINWLRSPIHDPEEFLKYIDLHGFPPFEMSNGVREKEREEKIRARMFGLMTLFKRMYIVLTEALLAEHIVPFFPEITMIDDELSLDKKRYQFNQKPENMDQIIISLDFSKWNSNMRKNETLPLFNCFDDMFGFKSCFSRTHEMFESSAIYLLNGTYLPKVESPLRLRQDLGCWYGHLGGIEGLRQKGWTIWTVGLILLASENLNFSLALMGQGDNQILRLRFPINTSYRESEDIMYQFLSNLNNILSKIGPPLKLEETWASRNLYVYGKYIIYNGVALPTSGKRIARIFRLSNEDYPTLESALSSATANLTAALSCHYCIGPLFVLYLSEVVGTLQLSMRSCYLQKQSFGVTFSKQSTIRIPGERVAYRDVPKITESEFYQPDLFYEALCIYPRALGGLPVMTVFDCLLRGFPDEVSYALASLKRIFPYTHPSLQKLITRMCSPPINSQMNYQLISEHPTVLNLEVPPAPSESRRNLIIDFVKSGDIHLNSYVRTFLDLLDSEEDKHVLKYLTTVEPFNPRLLSMFMGATAESRARHVAGKLQKTKTIATVARTLGSVDLYAKIIEAEKNHMGSIFRNVFSDHTNTVKWNSSVCSVEHATALRRLGWDREIVGVSCVPPHEFMSLELSLLDYTCLETYELSKGYVSIRFDPSYELDSFPSPLIKGPFPPYRGSVTRQKVSGYGDKIAAQAEPIIQKVLRLYSLVGWGIPSTGNLHTLCDKLLARHTDLPSEHLCPQDEEITGSVHHRLQDMRTGHGGSVPVLPNYGSKLMFDTFPLVAYSKGSKNVNLMFQSFMSTSVVLLGELISLGWKSNTPVIHLHVSSSCCVQELREELCESPVPLPFELTSYPDNPYLYVKKEKILMLMEKGLRFPINRNLGPDPLSLFHRFHSILAEECFHLLSPHHWDRPSFNFRTQQLVINWVLPCNASYLLTSISLRLCTHFLGAIRERDVTRFLARVSERIERAPMENWKALSALIFAPDIHHHVVGNSIFSRVSGNPICSESTLGTILKESVVSVISNWAHEPDTRKNLRYVDCYGRPYCGLSQHPSLLLVTRDWIMGNLPSVDIRDCRYLIINFLTTKPTGKQPSELLVVAEHYCKIGKLRISGENLDYLCKREDIKLAVTLPDSSLVDSISDGGEIILEFSRDHLIRTSHVVQKELIFSKSTSYENHLMKLASTPTTGTYKCLSFLNLIKIINPQFIGCLGDGGGGFTLATLLYYKNAKVFYNTLITKEVPIQQSSPIPFIPSLAGHKDLENRIVGLNITTEIVSDLTHKDLGMHLENKVSAKFDLILCDAEFTKEDAIEKGVNLVRGATRVARVVNSPYLVFKTYLKNISLISFQISYLLSHYNSVKVFRSFFSSTHNTEIYLIANDLGPELSLSCIETNNWNGYFLKPPCVDQLYQWRDYLVQSIGVDITELSEEYTKIIQPEDNLTFVTELRKYLPFSRAGRSFIYPSDPVKWIHDTSSEWTGKPQITRIRLETTTLHHSYLRRWAICLLLSYLMTNLENLLPTLPTLLETGSLVWFRLRNKSWDISLYFDPVDHIPTASGIKVYSFERLLTTSDLKLIYRLLGIMIYLNVSFRNSNISSPFYVRGDLTVNHKPLRDLQTAEISWVRDKIQFGTTSKVPTPSKKQAKPLPIQRRRHRL